MFCVTFQTLLSKQVDAQKRTNAAIRDMFLVKIAHTWLVFTRYVVVFCKAHGLVFARHLVWFLWKLSNQMPPKNMHFVRLICVMHAYPSKYSINRNKKGHLVKVSFCFGLSVGESNPNLSLRSSKSLWRFYKKRSIPCILVRFY